MIPGLHPWRGNWRQSDRKGQICYRRGTACCPRRKTTADRQNGKLELQRLRRQIAFDRFLARLFDSADTEWVLKGGYAMEFRFQIARATRDIDFTLRAVSTQGGGAVLGYLQETGRRDLNDFFSFRVGAP